MTNYWIVEKIGEKANVSVCSEAEAEVMMEDDDFEEWMIASTEEKSKDEMQELIEDNGLEFDPWI